MIYTKQEKQKLDRVISVFAERLKESDAFDLVWSDKVGYVLLDISTNYDYVDSARRIETAYFLSDEFPLPDSIFPPDSLHLFCTSDLPFRKAI